MKLRKLPLFAAMALFVSLLPLPLSADGDEGARAQTIQSAAEERATSFVGVKGATDESVPGGTLMVIAYAVVWLFLFLYLVRMARLQASTAKKLDQLEQKLRSE